MATIEELRQRVEEFARELIAREGLSADKPGVALWTVWEEAACDLGDAFAREILHQQVLRTAPAEQPHWCPECGAAGLWKKQRKRTIQTRRGVVPITEPECYCKRCRRSFFPSVGGTRSGGGLRL
jgi:hypothetical protein